MLRRIVPPERPGPEAGTVTARPGSVRFLRLEGAHDARAALSRDVRAGFSSTPKHLPPRYFYDERGSHLFEEITRLPEYYLTRAELAILERVGADIVASVAPVELVELGSGTSRKTRILLEAMRSASPGDALYVPLDVDESTLRSTAATLQADHPGLAVLGVVGAFEQHLSSVPRSGRRLLAFLGSTIGNLDEGERAGFLREAAASLEDGDRFLVGVDLVKDGARLVAAYNDSARVTDEFNLNVLRVLNRELGADFPLDGFDHVARWVPERSRMEMGLRARHEVTVTIPRVEMVVDFAAGEEMQTEISCKFTRPQVESELAAAGLALERWEEDPDHLFALALAAPTAR